MEFLTALCLHGFADVNQPLHVAKGKSTDLQMMYMHSLASTGLMFVFGATMYQFFAAWLSHIVIDTLKSRWKLFRSKWLDQALHLATIYLIFGAGITITPTIVLGLVCLMFGGWVLRTALIQEVRND